MEMLIKYLSEMLLEHRKRLRELEKREDPLVEPKDRLKEVAKSLPYYQGEQHKALNLRPPRREECKGPLQLKEMEEAHTFFEQPDGQKSSLRKEV